MGFFDKLFGKGKKDSTVSESGSEAKEIKEDTDEKDDAVTAPENAAEETAEDAAPTVAAASQAEAEPNIADGIADNVPENNGSREKVTAAFEMFPVKKDSVSAERNNAICAKFINEALAMGQELKEDDLQGLTYEELCMLYNHMQIMSLKLEPKIKAIAGVVIENNIKVTRAMVLKMLKKRTLYALYTKMNHLPFSNNAALYLFTDKALAESQVKNSDIKYLLLKEIPAEYVEMHFDLFYIAGYKEVILDTGAKLKLEELYTPKAPEMYGVINPEICRKMVFFNQMTETFSAKAKEQSKEVPPEEIRQINGVWADITEGLIKSVLLLPAEKTEDGRVRYKGAAVSASDGTKWIAMFTDQLAANTFFRASQITAPVKDPILSQYAAIKDKSEFAGIIINPARESFRIPSKVLASRKKAEMPENGSKPTEKTE